MIKKVIFIAVVVGAVMVVWNISKLYFADICYETSDDLLNEGVVEKSIFYAEKAVEFNPLEPNYYRGLGKAYLLKTLVVDTADEALVYKLKALENLQTAYYLNPKNLVTIRNLIPLYYFLAVKDLSLSSVEGNIDETMLPITKSYFDEVKNISPNDVGVYALLAKYQKKLNLTDDYAQSTNKIKELRPDLLDWYVD